nr:C25 family cysteine peptidase [Pyrinomonadaceae bacterium]
TLLTCLNGYYVDPTANDVFAEVALKNPNGGASAVWASSGLTTADIQEVMAKRFYYLIGNDPNFVRIGDLIKDSKTTIPFGRDVRLTWSFLGDPSMKVK